MISLYRSSTGPSFSRAATRSQAAQRIAPQSNAGPFLIRSAAACAGADAHARIASLEPRHEMTRDSIVKPNIIHSLGRAAHLTAPCALRGQRTDPCTRQVSLLCQARGSVPNHNIFKAGNLVHTAARHSDALAQTRGPTLSATRIVHRTATYRKHMVWYAGWWLVRRIQLASIQRHAKTGRTADSPPSPESALSEQRAMTDAATTSDMMHTRNASCKLEATCNTQASKVYTGQTTRCSTPYSADNNGCPAASMIPCSLCGPLSREQQDAPLGPAPPAALWHRALAWRR